MGLYPKICHYDEAYLDPVRTLVQSNPLVTALWGIPSDGTVLDYVWDEQERTFPTISSLLPPRESLSSSPERVFKGTLIRRPYNISVKHAPGTRGYIYNVSLEDTLVLKINWSNFRTAILGLQPKRRPSTIHKQKRREPSLITESCWKQTLHMSVSLHHVTNTPAYLGDIARIDAHHRRLSMEELLPLTVASHLTSNPYQIVFLRLPPNFFHGHLGL